MERMRDWNRIRFLREIQVRNHYGEPVGIMQYSFDNASFMQPQFAEVPFLYQAQAGELYLAWGGRRAENEPFGTIAVKP